MTASEYLIGTHSRAHWMRLDAAGRLKRLFYCEKSLILAQAGWLASIGDLDTKLLLARHLWIDALSAQQLRDRVFEMRFPSRLMALGEDAPLIRFFDEAKHAPNPFAFLLALEQVFKPALLKSFEDYLDHTDVVADGPTVRFMRISLQEKQAQIEELSATCESMPSIGSGEVEKARRWVSALQGRFSALTGVTLLDPLNPESIETPLPERREYAPAEPPVRDSRFHLCRFYWPDIIDQNFPYGEGLRLQLRTAVSHLNEVWAVESAGAALHAFGEILGWEFIYDAARWTYDESRHVQMGFERLLHWGYDLKEIPLGSYIFDSGSGEGPFYRMAMLFYFETKNIGKKKERARAFADYDDHLSQHDMEFDWADETIHASYGKHWLQVLHDKQPDKFPAPGDIPARCEALVGTLVASATETERRDINEVAENMIRKAEQQIHQTK